MASRAFDPPPPLTPPTPPAGAIVPAPLPIAAADEARFAALYARLSPRLRACARRQVGRAEADDVVQDVFLDLWRREQRGVVEWDAPMEPLLFDALRNRIATARRRRGREAGFLGRYLGYVIDFVRRWLGIGEEDGEDDASSRDDGIAAVVERVVGTLPDRCRAVFILVHEDRLSYADVGAALGIGPGTVKSQLVRAHRRLREALEAAGYSVSNQARPARRNAGDEG
jgi:RNA polymerase sigma-70 factor (ECF subfamily)